MATLSLITYSIINGLAFLSQRTHCIYISYTAPAVKTFREIDPVNVLYEAEFSYYV